MRLTLLARRPGTLWIGPDPTILTARTMYEVTGIEDAARRVVARMQLVEWG